MQGFAPAKEAFCKKFLWNLQKPLKKGRNLLFVKWITFIGESS